MIIKSFDSPPLLYLGEDGQVTFGAAGKSIKVYEHEFESFMVSEMEYRTCAHRQAKDSSDIVSSIESDFNDNISVMSAIEVSNSKKNAGRRTHRASIASNSNEKGVSSYSVCSPHKRCGRVNGKINWERRAVFLGKKFDEMSDSLDGISAKKICKRSLRFRTYRV